MNPPGKLLGVLSPNGGGDPIQLYKPELVVGRRKSCDLCLDFENISGKHCVFRLINGVWHLRDMGSTNGTTLNGLKLTREQGVMPDDEIGIASHYFRLEYEPNAPTNLLQSKQLLAEETDIVESRKQKSLMELAGFYDEESNPRGRRSSKRDDEDVVELEQVVELSPDETEFDDVVPDHFEIPKPKKAVASDSEFLRCFDDEFKGK